MSEPERQIFKAKDHQRSLMMKSATVVSKNDY